MATEQQKEFYDQLRQETEAKVQTYRGLKDQIEQMKRDIIAIKADMKYAAKQIDANNKMLASQGQGLVKFTDE